MNSKRVELGDVWRRAVALLWLVLATLPAARAQPPAALDAVVQFHTVCTECHEGECSGRLSFDSGPAAARAHIERYLGATPEVSIAAFFVMLRHVKETCSHYPAVPLRPAVGTWEAQELAPWRNARAGAYFIPLGPLAAGQRQLLLEFDRPAEGGVRVDDERMESLADERLCRDTTKLVEFAATAETPYYLHLRSGPATLSRITFR